MRQLFTKIIFRSTRLAIITELTLGLFIIGTSEITSAYYPTHSQITDTQCINDGGVIQYDSDGNPYCSGGLDERVKS